MSDSFTLADIRTKVENDLDLIDEDFITATEMTGYINEGISKCESIIHTINEDYFLTNAFLALVNGTATVALPGNIYGQKIRNIFYSNGSRKYEILRIKKLSEIPFVQAGDDYRYVFKNDATVGMKFVFYPTPAETSSLIVTCWYLRNAAVLVDEDDECDIPEFVEYVIQFTKCRCYEKEGHPNLPGAKAYLDELEKNMNDTLMARVVDEDTTVEKDMSFYDDFDSFDTGGF